VSEEGCSAREVFKIKAVGSVSLTAELQRCGDNLALNAKDPSSQRLVTHARQPPFAHHSLLV
jgi:hypothetical protein